MPTDSPEPLWRELVGDPEPWRRGRRIIVAIALLTVLIQGWVAYISLLAGGLERTLSFAAGLVLWWLMFAFVWFGTHWVRLLLGAYTLLIAFAELIWAIRDDMPIRFIAVVLNGAMGAALFAPSVYFFAVRQRERIRWPEKLVVVAVFLLLFGSLVAALFGFAFNRAGVQQNAAQYGERALDRLFVHNDTAFLYGAATESFSSKYGEPGLSELMARKYMLLGDTRALKIIDTKVRTNFSLPMTISYAAVVTAEGTAECGPVRVAVEVHRGDDGWKVHGLWWKCLNY